MRSRLLGALTVAALVTGNPVVAGAGSMLVTVTLAGSVPEPRRVIVPIDQHVCGQDKPVEDVLVSARRGIRNVVAWLENPPASADRSPPTRPVQMEQRGCVFTPRVALVPAGGTVSFQNSDGLLHNVHGRPNLNAPFNRTHAKGRPISIGFRHPEIVRVDCDLHPWMRAWVVVTEHPFYAVTNFDGQLRFDDLPATRYRVRLWHETLGTTTREVAVSGREPSRVIVEMAPK